MAEHLPGLDGVAAAAKRKAVRGHDLTEGEAARWSAITGLAARFAAADRLVTGAPMWNWAYPYELKQLID